MHIYIVKSKKITKFLNTETKIKAKYKNLLIFLYSFTS